MLLRPIFTRGASHKLWATWKPCLSKRRWLRHPGTSLKNHLITDGQSQNQLNEDNMKLDGTSSWTHIFMSMQVTLQQQQETLSTHLTCYKPEQQYNKQRSCYHRRLHLHKACLNSMKHWFILPSLSPAADFCDSVEIDGIVHSVYVFEKTRLW